MFQFGEQPGFVFIVCPIKPGQWKPIIHINKFKNELISLCKQLYLYHLPLNIYTPLTSEDALVRPDERVFYFYIKMNLKGILSDVVVSFSSNFLKLKNIDSGFKIHKTT